MPSAQSSSNARISEVLRLNRPGVNRNDGKCVLVDSSFADTALGDAEGAAAGAIWNQVSHLDLPVSNQPSSREVVQPKHICMQVKPRFNMLLIAYMTALTQSSDPNCTGLFHLAQVCKTVKNQPPVLSPKHYARLLLTKEKQASSDHCLS